MRTFGRYSLEEILPFIGRGHPKLWLHTPTGSYLVKTGSPRLECLKRNQTCVWCKRKGTIFLLQSETLGPPKVSINCFIEECPWCSLHPRPVLKEVTPHLNLYARDKSGNFILMTQDHILPKCAGGSNSIDNLQTMCSRCNQTKGSMLPGQPIEMGGRIFNI